MEFSNLKKFFYIDDECLHGIFYVNVNWNFKSYKFPISTKQDYTIRKGKKDKKINFLTLEEFKKYCINKIESDYERLIIVAKEHPGMTPIKEPMTSYYIESFE